MPFTTRVNVFCLNDINVDKSTSPRILPALIFFSLGLLSHRVLAQDTNQEWYFDQNALAGSAFGSQMGKYNAQTKDTSHDIEEGKNNVDISVNGTIIAQGRLVVFAKDEQGKVQPCIDQTLLNQLQIKSDKLNHLDLSKQCYLFSDLMLQKGSDWQYDSQKLSLNFIIPQSFLIHAPRGFISEKDWNTGITALWLQHNSNYSHVKNDVLEYDYFWSSINAGINLGAWQLRNQSYVRYLKYSNADKDTFDWQNNRTWLSRKFGSIDSELIIGNAYTDANIFDSMAFTGIKLATDKRMWPVGRLGYAPTVRGVAKTTSQVQVKQNNQIIYEITVAPGPFVINDLPDTNNRGDINVNVIGSDGVTDSFLVPYSHLASSMRPGTYTYSASVGKVRDFSNTNAKFAETTLQTGISNAITANTGVRLADDYVAILLGGVWGTRLGSIELNTTWSTAQIDNQSISGWRAEASYSKVFKSGTNLMLAAYRFSTQDYRDLQDVLGQREALADGTSYSSYTLQQRNRLVLSLNQNFGQFGNLSISASLADYYDQQSEQSQFQINYSKVWKGISFSLGATRQLVRYNTKYSYLDNYSLSSSTNNNSNETNYFASVTLPLDWGNSRSNVTTSITSSKNSTTTNANISGVTGKNKDLSWSFNASRNDYKDDDSSSTTNYFTGTLQQNTNVGAWRLMYSQDNDSNQQFGAGLSGSLLIHSGGITFGPWSSGTMALIEAKGATGATVQNGQGAHINSRGYALLSNLTPYRYNYVSLNTGDMSLDTELKNTSQRVVPYAGAFVKVKFDTVQGRAVLITGQSADGKALPMGAEVSDDAGHSLGMIGQGGQFYARLTQSKGDLRVQTTLGKYCHIPYDVSSIKANTTLSQLAVTCVAEN